MSRPAPGSDEDFSRLRDEVAAELDALRTRIGGGALESRYERMGRRVVQQCRLDGEPADPGLSVSGGAWYLWAYHRFGRTPMTTWLSVPADGPLEAPRFELDLPPAAAVLRDVELYVLELRLRPRPSALVPGWMKVELAAVGAWDLRTDQPTWDREGPTGQPHTPESAGVPLPPGGEWAL